MHLSIGESRVRATKRHVRCWVLLLASLALAPTSLLAQSYSERQVLHATAQGEGFAGMQFGGGGPPPDLMFRDSFE